jgi:hypothetical protein
VNVIKRLEHLIKALFFVLFLRKKNKYSPSFDFDDWIFVELSLLKCENIIIGFYIDMFSLQPCKQRKIK